MQNTSQPAVYQTSYGWTMNPISPAIPRPPAQVVRPFRKLRLRRNRQDSPIAHPGESRAMSTAAP